MGKGVLTASGKGGLLPSGKAALFDSSGTCAECCGGGVGCEGINCTNCNTASNGTNPESAVITFRVGGCFGFSENDTITVPYDQFSAIDDEDKCYWRWITTVGGVGLAVEFYKVKQTLANVVFALNNFCVFGWDTPGNCLVGVYISDGTNNANWAKVSTDQFSCNNGKLSGSMSFEAPCFDNGSECVGIEVDVDVDP